MKKKIGIMLLILIVIVGTIAYFYPRDVNGDDDMNVPIFESVPDKMVIYQGDMALVRDEMKIYSGKQVQVILPPQAIPETVQIIDGGKKVERFNLAYEASRGKSYSSSGAGIKNLLSWKSKKAGSRTIRLDYMMRGLSWTPTYIMDIVNDQKVKLNYRVGIRNSTTASSNVDLILVSGEIGTPTKGSGYYYRSMNKAQATLASYERQSRSAGSRGTSFLKATKINAYYTYKMPKARLEKNGISYVTITDNTLPAQKEFVWVTSTGEQVDIIYTVENKTKTPFAEGLVSVYDSGIFIGSDIIEWTPSGAKGHVTVGGAVDIQAVKNVDISEIVQRKRQKEYKHKVKMVVKNYANKTRVVKVIEQKYPDAVEAEFGLQPKKSEANTYLWTLSIPPKSEKVIKYQFYSDSRYQNPYQIYR
ncbi:MAG: DUF4139 domain-containing protein [Candidatus Eremiobacteraeota bacterium]|nr:DUF4139 domain-containing protein [Candidatus Eremiobacteraeota bacterium]